MHVVITSTIVSVIQLKLYILISSFLYILRVSFTLKAFSEFLGEKQDIFIKICSDIDKYKIGKDGISIINIRNGIAHGDPEITENCDESCYKEVIRLVYEPPIKILFSIIINSMRV